MNRPRDNEYQDRKAVGSLVGALALWQALVTVNRHDQPQQLAFGLVCSSEARALRVAAFLRRHRACALAQVNPIEAERRANWCVRGTTRREVQSLANLEDLFMWLRAAARAHQVHLLDLRLTQSA